MITNTVRIANSVDPSAQNACHAVVSLRASVPRFLAGINRALPLFALALLLVASPATLAAPVPSPWIPLFKGVDQANGTNTPGISGNFSELQVVRCVRIDLNDPDVKLLTTPPASSSAADSRETLTLTVPDFLKHNNLQIAADSNFYSANPGGSDPSSEGVSCEVFGLQISAGAVVSAADSQNRYASILFTTNNRPILAFNNRSPGTNTTGIYTAITGYYPIVANGVNVGAASINAYPDSFIHQTQPRTAYGISRDGRYLYMMTIDGRQGPMDGAGDYSDGALDSETAYWIMQFGAWNAINMDGGGSTALYMADSTGIPVVLNHSSYLAAYGHERYIGSHLGVSAKPLPGFINDVNALPDDTAATITWTTVSPSTTQVEYGLSTNFTLLSALNTTLSTNHAVLLTNLSPGLGYYFAAVSKVGAAQYVSSNFFFATSNYATTNAVFDLPQPWSYTTANLDGVNWTARTYDDSAWDGQGPGVLWADTRGANSLGHIPATLATEMPLDPSTGYPFLTYYLRAHLNFTNNPLGVSLLCEAWVDDGAVFYLNGVEFYRVCMPAAPAPIYNSTLASSYYCSGGDASCSIDFGVSGAIMTNLLAGDNVLAVEVHNYNPLSPDITFGMSLSATVPFSIGPRLNLATSPGTAVLSWTRGGFTLQQASSPAGPWIDAPGPVFTSPYTAACTGLSRFFRLRR